MISPRVVRHLLHLLHVATVFSSRGTTYNTSTTLRRVMECSGNCSGDAAEQPSQRSHDTKNEGNTRSNKAGGGGGVCGCVYLLFVRVAGATCVCVCFWARRIVRRRRHCAVAVRPALSPRETTHPVSLFLSPLGVDRQASRDTALHLRCHCCTDSLAAVLSGNGPLSHLVSEVDSGGRYGQSRTPHLGAVPTLLSNLGVNEWDTASLCRSHLTLHLHVRSGA